MWSDGTFFFIKNTTSCVMQAIKRCNECTKNTLLPFLNACHSSSSSYIKTVSFYSFVSFNFSRVHVFEQ